MSLITIDASKCNKDGLCVEVCPTRVMEIGPEGFPVESAGGPESCLGCGHCLAVCPSGALSHAQLPGEGLEPSVKVSDVAMVDGLLKSRRSVREFKDKPIPDEIFADLFEAVRFAPTAVNYQNLSWIVTRNRVQTLEAAKLCVEWMRDNWGRARMLELWDAGVDTVLRNAPHVALALAPLDSAWAEADASIAVTFMDLAAHARGLGGCWAGLLTRATNAYPPLAKFLGVPEGRKVGAAIMLGYPKYRYRLIPPRKAAEVTWL